jgi:hypothetical protein
MAGLTNRGKKLILDMAFRAQSEPIRYYVHLLTSSATITADTNTWSDISANEISGGGYGEATAIRGVVDFDVSSENDSADQGEVQLADVNWTAVGSSIVARYAALTDDAGGSGGHADNNVIAYWNFGSDQTTTATNVFTLSNFVIRIDES